MYAHLVQLILSVVLRQDLIMTRQDRELRVRAESGNPLRFTLRARIDHVRLSVIILRLFRSVRQDVIACMMLIEVRHS